MMKLANGFLILAFINAGISVLISMQKWFNFLHNTSYEFTDDARLGQIGVDIDFLVCLAFYFLFKTYSKEQ